MSDQKKSWISRTLTELFGGQSSSKFQSYVDQINADVQALVNLENEADGTMNYTTSTDVNASLNKWTTTDLQSLHRQSPNMFADINNEITQVLPALFIATVSTHALRCRDLFRQGDVSDGQRQDAFKGLLEAFRIGRDNTIMRKSIDAHVNSKIGQTEWYGADVVSRVKWYF